MRSLSRSSLIGAVAGSAAVVACGAGAWADSLPATGQIVTPSPVQQTASPVPSQPTQTPSEVATSPAPTLTPTTQPSPSSSVEPPVTSPSATEAPTATDSPVPVPVEEPQPTPSPSIDEAQPSASPLPVPTTHPSEIPSESSSPSAPENTYSPTPAPVIDATGTIADYNPVVSPSPVIAEPTQPSNDAEDNLIVPATPHPPAPSSVPPASTPVTPPAEPVAPQPTAESNQETSAYPGAPQPAPPVEPHVVADSHPSLSVPQPNVLNTQQSFAPQFSIQPQIPAQSAPVSAVPVPHKDSLSPSSSIIEQANHSLMTLGVQSKPVFQHEDHSSRTVSTLGSIFSAQGSTRESRIPGAAEWVSSYLNATEPKERGRLTAGSNFGVNGAKDTKSAAGSSSSYGNVMRGEGLISGVLPLAAFSVLAFTSIAVIIRIFIATNRKS